jgi:hypothetical protein
MQTMTISKGTFRLFIDDSGDDQVKSCSKSTERYLCLTGLCFDRLYHDRQVFPELEKLKSVVFGSNQEAPVVLHRDDIIKKRPPFNRLADPRVNAEYESKLIEIFSRSNYLVFTVFLDKFEWCRKYPNWNKNVYQVCLENLIERYALWLQSVDSVGDVVIEERGKKEDRELRASYNRLYQYGNNTMKSLFSKRISSSNLKISRKKDNIAGLQLADLVVTPLQRRIRKDIYRHNLDLKFGGKLIEPIYRTKYYRSTKGDILGYGIKIRP